MRHICNDGLGKRVSDRRDGCDVSFAQERQIALPSVFEVARRKAAQLLAAEPKLARLYVIFLQQFGKSSRIQRLTSHVAPR